MDGYMDRWIHLLKIEKLLDFSSVARFSGQDSNLARLDIDLCLGWFLDFISG